MTVYLKNNYHSFEEIFCNSCGTHLIGNLLLVQYLLVEHNLEVFNRKINLFYETRFVRIVKVFVFQRVAHPCNSGYQLFFLDHRFKGPC